MRIENNLNVAEYLEKLANTNLEVDVIRSLKHSIKENNTLEYWISFLDDIVTNGAGSGIVESLIYKKDVVEFALDNFEDIIELIEYLKLDVKVSYNLLEKLAYIGYEQVCRKMLAILEAAEEENEHSEKKGEITMTKNLDIIETLHDVLPTTDLYKDVLISLWESIDSCDVTNWIKFVSNVVDHGISSGLVRDMIYTVDVEQFAIDNMYEITEIIEDLNLPFKVTVNILTDIATFGYEHACTHILKALNDFQQRLEDNAFVEEIFA